MDYGDDEDEELRAAIAASARGACPELQHAPTRRDAASPFTALRASARAR